MDQPWKVVLVLVALFLAGGVTGGFVTARFTKASTPDRRQPSTQNGQQPKRPVDQWGQQFLDQMAKRISLSTEQRTKTDTIIQKMQEEMRKLRQQTFVQTNEVQERMAKQIRELLTEVQRPEFDAMITERRERTQRLIQDPRMQRGEPPGGGPGEMGPGGPGPGPGDSNPGQQGPRPPQMGPQGPQPGSGPAAQGGFSPSSQPQEKKATNAK